MAWIERHWQRFTPVTAALCPLSLLFGAAAVARRTAYRAGLVARTRLPVPVIVAGNITAGGTGKTPLALWLAARLRARGYTPAIVCRGYGGSARVPQRVLPDSDPYLLGDEAVLLARRSGCEVWAGADRVAASRSLLAGGRPACDVLISDDGLQHYALERDVEICVVDAARGFGNGWLLPAGPLRERPSRLATVDAVVIHAGVGGASHPSLGGIAADIPRFAMRLEGSEFRNLRDPARRVGPGFFRGRRVHAIAGIGHPERFFSHLRALGIDFAGHPWPDHHPFTASDLAFQDADAVLMTEKDAVKCRRFAAESHWELAVDAVPDNALGELVLRKIETRG
ncbi:MAG TPA: tetraacyldisaccharide 4'-kinase [Burkholderiales bacterium]|jgi:tetraacyldisaccharide 4'-kinase